MGKHKKKNTLTGTIEKLLNSLFKYEEIEEEEEEEEEETWL